MEGQLLEVVQLYDLAHVLLFHQLKLLKMLLNQ